MIRRSFILIAIACLIHPVLAQQAVVKSSAVETWQAFMSSTGSILDMPTAQRAPQLALLGAALLENPVAISDDLERSGGGKRALRAYAQAMIEDGNLVPLVHQLHVVMHGGAPAGNLAEALNASRYQDGSVWFPQAEQAGFFAGAIAAVLDGKSIDDGNAVGDFLSWVEGQNGPSKASETIAQRFGVRPPAAEETVAEWMLAVFTNSASQVSVPAAQWFEKGFAAGYR
ncbi:hypothetical protein N8A98_00265 (plasmid) [Devosia neptuniae]|uniref:Uncharacterized protein n=1 Tax=Devosia neptuniae TaxID=191302 RepID=A0ABY6CD03_9HYPH|nr:hypothetical protein [Devosia neptuniae]UXN67993.1 hypothetical protein N8A98_00265 [Devosia neptuniae]